MSGQLRVDEITDELGTGSPNFPNGITPASLGSGTPNNTNFLRGDGSWQTISSDTTINTLDPMLKTMLIYGTALNEPVWHYTSKTVTLAANVPHLIMVFGSGGGGGRGPVGSGEVLHGGNGGDTALKFITPSSNTNVTITIGAGGAGRNTNGNGSDGAATTVVGTGVNINVPGGRGGVRLTGLGSNNENRFNAANADPTGADLFFKGGRTRSWSPGGGEVIHGSTVFGSNGTRLIANFGPGNPFVSGGPTGFVRISGEAKEALVDDANAFQSLNNTETNNFVPNYTDKYIHRNLLSIILPQLYEFFAPVSQTNNESNFSGGRLKFPFMPGIAISSSLGSDLDNAGGRAAGGGPNFGTTTSQWSGKGGDGLVIIWSFVNG
jgi:hypothetical protein